jgi:hypothetical protein
MRVCTFCLQQKATAEFYFNSAKGSYPTRCRECHHAYDQAKKARDPEAHRRAARARSARWREANREQQRENDRSQQREWRARLRAAGIKPHAKRMDGAGGLYFIQEEDHGPIKIGWTKNSPRVRLEDLQVGNPRPPHIVAMMPGTILDETRLHDRFRHLNIRGEWFRPEADLLDFIRLGSALG